MSITNSPRVIPILTGLRSSKRDNMSTLQLNNTATISNSGGLRFNHELQSGQVFPGYTFVPDGVVMFNGAGVDELPFPAYPLDGHHQQFVFGLFGIDLRADNLVYVVKDEFIRIRLTAFQQIPLRTRIHFLCKQRIRR